MLLIEYHNKIIYDLLIDRILQPAALDQSITDFDGVRYHFHTPESKTGIHLSIAITCWQELSQYGALDIVTREYGPYIHAETEPGYNLTLALDLSQIGALDDAAKHELVSKVALLKRNIFAAPFEKAFAEQRAFEKSMGEKAAATAGRGPTAARIGMHAPSIDAAIMSEGSEKGQLMMLHYRDQEAIYVQASTDRVTVIFRTVFKEETDKVFGRVFLQEFLDARRRPAIQSAPQVLYSNREAPLEIRHLKGDGMAEGEDVGYITFVLFPRHISPQNADATISHLQTFRTNFHYHIKCSKAYMHSRMRARVSEFLKILNRAKPETTDEASGGRRTASGRFFAGATKR